VPVIYDRLALALMASFGAVVEYLPFDWRRPIALSAEAMARTLGRALAGSPARRVAIVAHSMGGLVAAGAVRALGAKSKRVLGTVTLGTPWLGSYEAALNLRGEGRNLRRFSVLASQPRERVLAVAQSFWGLSDHLPADEAALLELLAEHHLVALVALRPEAAGQPLLPAQQLADLLECHGVNPNGPRRSAARR